MLDNSLWLELNFVPTNQVPGLSCLEIANLIISFVITFWRGICDICNCANQPTNGFTATYSSIILVHTHIQEQQTKNNKKKGGSSATISRSVLHLAPHRAEKSRKKRRKKTAI